MSLVTWFRRRKALASTTALAVLIAAPVTIAVLHDGFPLSEVDLRAWSVWVTNTELGRTARLNTEIKELDSKVAAQSMQFDVLQDGDDVFVHDSELANVQRVDPAFATLGQRIDTPGAEVSYGGGRIAIVQPGDGSLWVLEATSALQFDEAAPPLIKLGAGGAAVVALDGSVIAISTKEKAMLELRPGQGEFERKATVDSKDFELSAVGSHGVVLDRETGRLIFSDGSSATADEPMLRLQQPGPERDTALVATATSLLQVGRGGVQQEFATELSGSAEPIEVAAPVVLGACLHGAWSAGAYLAACDGEQPRAKDLGDLGPDAHLTFRVNRNVVALNETSAGRLWVVQDAELVEVDNPDWSLTTPPVDDESENTDQQTTLPNFEQAVTDRSEENHAPVARADQLGARPGKTVILDVLANDSDPDGDILTISSITGIPAGSGTVELIEGGRALQFVPSETASGTVSFRYAITDGRLGGTAESTIDVAVRPLGSTDTAPVQTGTSAIIVETGRTISYNVLGDWFDPDGDDLILSSANTSGLALVRFSPDGLVTFTHLGSELGPIEVSLTVSDGQLETQGRFIIDVKGPGETSPVAVPDFAKSFVSQPARVTPLDNDLSPSGETLTLGEVTAIGGDLVVSRDLDRGAVSIVGGAPGTHYVEYEVFAGAKKSVGLIRVDIGESLVEALPPIAVKDTAYLRPNQPVVVEVLANDVSPSGAVLGVQRVDVPDSASMLSVELLSSTRVRITAGSGMTEPVEFRYTISDGVNSSSAGVSVVPIPELTRHQAPIAIGDSTKVRVGDIASVSVLANDFHPDGARMMLDPELVQANVGDGLAFVTGDQVRLQAPTAPGTYQVTYRVTDAFDEAATATVGFTVLDRDPETNAAPIPVPITARVFQGATFTIDVPLDGIDPDGDSVTFLGAGAPLLGTVSSPTSQSFTYQAYEDPSAGTDTFTYQVQDAFGASATGEVRIAVIPRDGVAPPNAVDDEVEIRPGRVSTVPVLGNDTDPNGFKIRLLPELLEVQEGITAAVDHDSVVVTAGEPGTYAVRYQLTNDNSTPVDAFLIVTVSPDAPLQPPAAFDQYVDSEESVGERTMPVDVLHNAQNPGGLRSDLVVTLEGPNAQFGSVGADGVVAVELGDTRRAIAYRITNEVDELSAMAFIIVPRFTDSARPYLRQDLEPQNVSMNGSISWNLSDIIVVPSGRAPRVADPDTASAGRQDPEIPMVENSRMRITYTPEKDFRGKTVVSFKVTDGDSAADPNAASIQIPVTVGDPSFRDVPPSFSDQVIEVQPGEDAVELDLRDASSHPNPALIQDFTYSNLQGPSGPVKASLSGSTLRAWTESNDPSIPAAEYTVEVTLGDLPPTTATIRVKPVASTRPLPQAIEDVEPEGRSTSSYTVSVLDNDFNPFATEGRPLRVVDVAFEGDRLGASETHTESSVRVTTGTAKSGTVSLIYTLADDVDRTVQGRITIVVASAPEPVTDIVLTNPSSQTVSAVFQPPASSNGAEITSYTVRISGTPGTAEQACAAGANCVFSGRTNGAVQTIEVGATNKVGTTWSTQRAITPYGTPSVPTAPVLNTNSATAPATITPTWAGPADAGGGSITYEWNYTAGTSGSGSTAGTSGPGASVGQGDYTFQVRACNPGGCSAYVSASRHIDVPPPQIVSVSQGGSANGGNARLLQINVSGMSGTHTFCIDGRVRPGGAWGGWWTDTGPGTSCFTGTVTGGSIVTTNAWLNTNNIGTYDVRITSPGVPTYTQVIW